LANLQQTRVGKNWGWRGHSPLPGGFGGCFPKTKTRGELLTFTNLPPSGTQNVGKPSANEGGQKLGVEGAVPPPRGQWGMCPHKTLKGEAANPSNPATEWDSKRWRTLSKRGWGKTGGGVGRAPSQGAVGDVPPQNLKRGKLPTFLTLPPSGTQNIGEPSANEGGEKPGVEWAEPHPRGLWGMCPQNKKQGVSC